MLKTKYYNAVLSNFTVAKFLAALITALLLAGIKFSISGNFHVSWQDYYLNVFLSLSAWVINTGIVGGLTELLNFRNLNVNLYEVINGENKVKMGGDINAADISKPKLYNAMDGNTGDQSSVSGGQGGASNNLAKIPKNINEWITDAQDKNDTDLEHVLRHLVNKDKVSPMTESKTKLTKALQYYLDNLKVEGDNWGLSDPTVPNSERNKVIYQRNLIAATNFLNKINKDVPSDHVTPPYTRPSTPNNDDQDS